jgi:high-affinity iron transporter
VFRFGLALSTLALAAIVAGCGGAKLLATAQVSGTTQTVARVASAPAQVSAASAAPGHASAAIPPIVPIQLYQPLAQYKLYVDRLLARLRPRLQALRAAAASDDRYAAEHDWLAAHASWLEIGQDDDAYGAFGQLGEQIDGPAYGLPGTTANPGFTGFHKVELDLWREHNTGAAAKDAGKLVSLVGQLTPAAVAKDLPTSTLALDSWVLRCHEILEDALRDSLTQNDDYGSNSDLASLAADVDATREMLAILAPLVDARVPSIVTKGSTDLSAIDDTIQTAGGPVAGRSLAALRPRERQAIDQATSAVLEVLAPVSELMQVTVPGS